jgi:ribonucleotide reductase alpha subunit
MPIPVFVTKRDKTIAEYTIDKIRNVLGLAFKHSNTVYDDATFGSMLNFVDTEIKQYVAKNDQINVEDIQDIVENALMTYSYYGTAKHYIQYRYNRNEQRKIQTYISKIPDDVETPWGMLGYITYKRTYARRLNENTEETEEFRDTILRVLDACQKQLNVGFTNTELKRAYYFLKSLKCSVAGRFLWQLLTPTVNHLGLMSLQNCAFTKIDHPVRPFVWIFDVLMLGTGVGFNVQRHNIDKLPPVMDVDIQIIRKDTKDADFIVPDSREGWTYLLEKVLEAFFIKGRGFSYSTILIRSAGSKIAGFGGTASGPEDLVKGIHNIAGLLQTHRGKKLNSVNCLDIVNIIAMIVVSGNVRRSALVCLGDYDDIEYLNAKRWDLGNIPNWRCMSNNSVICDDIEKLPAEFWDGYNGGGECYGLINMELSRRVGRIKDGDKYPDPDVEGYNPCCEQSLANYETCCLGEIFLPNVVSYDELKEIATVIYRICKHSLLLPCHHPETDHIVHKNMRMGIGITGYMQCSQEQKDWLEELYCYIREYDADYSRQIGAPPSIKLTTVKPSGTLSLLAGVTSGCHPGIFQYFIRRIRISSGSSLIALCRKNGYFVEYQKRFDGSDDNTTMVVEFPCKYPEGTVLAEDLNAIQQLETIKHLQTVWSDNSVSVTIYYKPEELPAIRDWLRDNFAANIKSVSFMLHVGHNFTQAPFESITKEQYEEMIVRVIPIVCGGGIEAEDEADYSNEVCKGGVCPIK